MAASSVPSSRSQIPSVLPTSMNGRPDPKPMIRAISTRR